MYVHQQHVLFACTLMLSATFIMIFLILLRKLSCENIYLLYSILFKLLERFIKVLAAILVLEVLQVSLRSCTNSKTSKNALSLKTILMQKTSVT